MRTALPIIVALVAGCAGVASDAPEPRRPRAGGEALYEVDSTVLEDRTHGPALCLGVIATSLPPQCGDVPLRKWSWDEVNGERRLSGTTWGTFHVVGEYEDGVFVVREVGPPTGKGPSAPDDDIPIPCQEPAGGWAASDPSRTSEADLNAAMAAARAEPDHSGQWIQTVRGEGVTVVDEETVLVVAFTGDLEEHEAELATVWGGPLCVVQHERSERELLNIQREFSRERHAPFDLHVLWSDVDVVDGVVEVGVVVADEAAQHAIDRRYGDGVVELFPALHPVE